MKYLAIISITTVLVSAGKSGDICNRRNYDRGAGKIRSQCLDNEERTGGLCYPKCRPGYYGSVTRCMVNCPGKYSNQCGPEYCAASKGDCAKMIMTGNYNFNIDCQDYQ